MNYLKKAVLAAGLLGMVAMAGTAVAQAADISRGDREFLRHAAQANTFESEASLWTQRNGEQDEVKRYAGLMVQDHATVARQLKELAAAKGVELPADLPPAQARILKELQSESGTRLDRSYADKVAVAAHKDAVELYSDATGKARDPEIKAFAQQTLPSLKAHLDEGIALQKSVAASGQASPPERAAPAPSGVPGGVSPAAREAPPSLLPGDKGAPTR
jgi:putative membrane protein